MRVISRSTEAPMLHVVDISNHAFTTMCQLPLTVAVKTVSYWLQHLTTDHYIILTSGQLLLSLSTRL